jgi:F0F1-type ATP synthase assembly protein I
MRSDLPEPDQLRIRDLLTLGGMLVGCIVAGVVGGIGLDAWLGTAPILLLVGSGLGIAAAAAGFWFRVRAFLRGTGELSDDHD